MVENMSQLIHQKHTLPEEAEQSYHRPKCILLILFLNFEILEHETSEVDILHPMVLNLREVLQPIREVIIMTDDETQLHPGCPQEGVTVQSGDERLDSKLLFFQRCQGHAIEIAVQVIELPFFKRSSIDFLYVFCVLVNRKVLTEFVIL